jgi:hypothetical protein
MFDTFFPDTNFNINYLEVFLLNFFLKSRILYRADQGRVQDFKLGRAHLKKLRRTEEGAKYFWVFRVKNNDFMPKNHIFSNFRGGRAPGAHPPLYPPLLI